MRRMLKMLFMIVIYAALPGCSFNNSENSITYPDSTHTTLKVLKKGCLFRHRKRYARWQYSDIEQRRCCSFVYASSCYVVARTTCCGER